MLFNLYWQPAVIGILRLTGCLPLLFDICIVDFIWGEETVSQSIFQYIELEITLAINYKIAQKTKSIFKKLIHIVFSLCNSLLYRNDFCELMTCWIAFFGKRLCTDWKKPSYINNRQWWAKFKSNIKPSWKWMCKEICNSSRHSDIWCTIF